MVTMPVRGAVRQALLDAARARFEADGALSATLDEIRREAGVSVGALYHHFADKQALATALYVDALARYQEGFLAVLRERSGAEEGVRAIVAFHLRWCAENRADTRFLLAGRSLADDAVVREGGRAFFAEVLAWWAPHAHYGAVRDVDIDLINALWLGPSQEYIRHWVAGRSKRVPAAVAATLADAAWHALRHPEQTEAPK
jgi:AcrR family transcriptional regulator